MSGAKTIEKALMLFTEGLKRPEGVGVAALAARLKLPPATAYRHVAAFERFGLLHREPDGRLTAGTLLLETFHKNRFRERLAQIARPVLRALSQEMETICQLGVFEQDMVTYLVKVEPKGSKIFTRESDQLEAYCSGIGKVLLAGLPRAGLDAYLAGGPFPALTRSTITDESALAREIRTTRRRGYGLDRGEIDDNLYCLAVPLRGPHGDVIAGLSLSSPTPAFITSKRPSKLAAMKAAAARIAAKLYGAGRAREKEPPADVPGAQ